MTRSGGFIRGFSGGLSRVLIPLLVDDPLWENYGICENHPYRCLNPSFSGWPALGLSSEEIQRREKVLIPLLVDDPLWDQILELLYQNINRLNPSFSGWPALGNTENFYLICVRSLNPSFSGWPALGNEKNVCGVQPSIVLIPLLVDDPLWV